MGCGSGSWEKELWENFLNTINNFRSDPSNPHNFRWTANSNGRYSANSWCKLVQRVTIPQDEVWNLIWTGLSPPKVEAFLSMEDCQQRLNFSKEVV
ncbi:hypothetical protein V6N13_136742 [Hibiscus sabdariffa]